MPPNKLSTPLISTLTKKHSGNLNSTDVFDYNKGEASALGFEPLSPQMSKPEINVVNLSDYTQVSSEVTTVPIFITSPSTGKLLHCLQKVFPPPYEVKLPPFAVVWTGGGVDLPTFE